MPSRSADRQGASGRTDRVPLRSCVGCRRRRPKPELVRLALAAAGTVILDPLAQLPGRGAYLCRDSGAECLRAAGKRRGLSRSLRVGENVIDPETLGPQLSALASKEPPSPR